MHIRCPHCHNPIELAIDTPLAEINCPSCGSSFSLLAETVTHPHETPRRAGRFELIEFLGRGAVGEVWKARDPDLDRPVAVKIPRKGQLDPQEIEQFLREARAAAQLRHPHIVSVHEVGRDRNALYIVSDFVQGATLADWLTGRRLTPREVAELCVTIAAALHHAHEAGVIHRDLKPGNIMMDMGGQPHLMDFGLARRVGGEITVTVDGQVLGTPAYMSPEQARGQAHRADRRTDIYSLGVIMFELLTGELPFRGNARMLVVQIQTEEAPSPRKLNASVARDLETITLKCLEKEPRRRYASARDVADELGRYLSGEPIRARPISRPARAWRWCRRKPVAAALVVTAALLLVVLGVGGPIVAIREAGLSQIASNREAHAKAALNTARHQTRVATARYLAAESAAVGDEYPVRSVLLAGAAVEATQRHGEPVVGAAINALRAALGRLGGIPLAQHDESLSCLAISPDGRRVVTGSNKAALVWDLSSNDFAAEPIVLRGHEGWINCLEFSRDGSTLVTGSRDGTARAWDLASADPAAGSRILRGHEDSIEHIAISRDGRTVVTGSRDRTARVWDLSGRPAPAPNVLRGHEGAINCLAISPDGRTLVTGSYKTARVWDLSAADPSGAPKVLRGHDGPIECLAISPDGRTLVTGSWDHAARVWDLSAADPPGAPKVLRGHDERIECLAISPDGRTLVTGSWDHTARAWDLSSADPAAGSRILRGHENVIEHITISPDGRTLVTGSWDHAARVWDLSSNDFAAEPIVLQGHAGGINCLGFSRDGRTLVTGSWDGTARVWDISAADPAAGPKVVPGHESVIDYVSISADGRTLVTECRDDTARVWDLTAAEPRVVQVRKVPIGSLAMIADFHTLATGNMENTELKGFESIGRVWRRKGAPLLANDNMIDLVATVAKGDKLVTVSSDNTARVWDPLSTGDAAAKPKVLRGHENMISLLTATADGRTLVTMSSDQVRVWDLSAPDPAVVAKVIRLPKVQIECMAITPDGRTLVTGNMERTEIYDLVENTIRVWDLSAADPAAAPKILRGHEYLILCLAISADGRTLVTGSEDDTARVWDLSAADPGADVDVLRGHKGDIRCVAFTPDGRTLVTGSMDNTARLWELRVDALQEIAAQVTHRELTAHERARYGLAQVSVSTQTAQRKGARAAVKLAPWHVRRFPQPADASWHAAQLRECEARGHAFGAQFHRERLARLHERAKRP